MKSIEPKKKRTLPVHLARSLRDLPCGWPGPITLDPGYEEAPAEERATREPFATGDAPD